MKNFLGSALKAIWHLCTRQAYYITGTFINKEGERMFCKTIFETSMNRLPIHNLAKMMGEEFGIDKPVLILNFFKIPWSQAKYMGQYHEDVNIVMATRSQAAVKT